MTLNLKHWPASLMLLTCTCTATTQTKVRGEVPYYDQCVQDYADLGYATPAEWQSATSQQQTTANSEVQGQLEAQGATLLQAQDAEAQFHLAFD